MLIHRPQKHLIIALIILFAAAIAALAPEPARGHNVTVFAWVDGDTVHVESKFSGGRKPKQAAIEVFDAAGNRLLAGQTDSEGRFSFAAPQPSDMIIVLQAGAGHRAEWRVQADEFGQAPAAATSPSDPQPGNNHRQAGAKAASNGSPSPTAEVDNGSLTADQVQTIVEEALDSKLKPVMKHIAETRQKGPSISEILGGIGYILGLVGLGAYMQFRRNKKR